MAEILHLNGLAYDNLLRTVIESGNREPRGHVFIKRRNGDYIVENAYPNITALRKPSLVEIGNVAAFYRLVGPYGIQSGLNNGCMVGGYHSHTSKDSTRKLSDGDMNAIRDEAAILKQPFLIELLIKMDRVKDSNYKNPGIKLKPRNKALDIMIHGLQGYNYSMILSAYLVSREDWGEKSDSNFRRNSRGLYEGDENVSELKIQPPKGYL